MAELIAAGTTQADSADFTVVAGTPTTLYIKPATGSEVPIGPTYLLQHKTPAAAYITVAILNARNTPVNVSGAGTFRVRRLADTTSTGMDQD